MLIVLILIFLKILFLSGLITNLFIGIMIISLIIMTFILKGVFWGILNLMISLFFLILIFFSIEKIKFWNRFRLTGKNIDASNRFLINDTYDQLLDLTHITLTKLKPSGYIVVKKINFEVISENLFISRNQKVRKVSIEGSKLKVINIEDQP